MPETLQERVVRVGAETWGYDNMRDKEERLKRFAEEAFELLQAAGMKFEEAAAMLGHVYYTKKPGRIPQELAGTHCTLLSLSNSHAYYLDYLTEAEIQRVADNKELCRAKHDAKPESIAKRRTA